MKKLLVAGLGTMAWLAGAATVARADTLTLTDDTNVNLSLGAVNFGSSLTLPVRNAGIGGTSRAFVRFDLSVLPPDAVVARATLRLWVDSVGEPGAVGVHLVTGNWSESTATGNTQPSLAAAPLASFNVVSTSQRRFVAVDITDTVQDWLDGSVPNRGLALLPSSADPVRVDFDTKETLGTSHAPEIEVVLGGLDGAPGAVGPMGPAGAPGAPGAPGAEGPPGATGSAGLTGPIGPQGSAGESVVGMSVAPGDPSCPDGGAMFVVGSTVTYACNGALGAEGESVVGMSVAEGDANCPHGGSKFLVGDSETYACSGADGADGAQGVAGLPGAPGAVGAQGPPGPPGVAGMMGVPGPQGADGAPGAQGTAGAQGPMGPAGAAGPVGPQGPEGQTSAIVASVQMQHSIDDRVGWTHVADMGDDLCFLHIPLGFTFNGFGASVSTISLSSNGVLFFGQNCITDLSNQVLPTLLSTNAFLAFFWDDLRDFGPTEFFEYATFGTAGGRVFNLYFRSRRWDTTACGTDPIQVMVTIHEGSNLVKAVYSGFSGCAQIRGSSATFGLQTANGAEAFNVATNSPVLDDNSNFQSMSFHPPN